MDSIVIHPTYFPTIVQMVAVVQAKKIIFEVCDNYQKQTYRNRTYIAHTNGKLLLNIPIKHNKVGKRQKTSEVKIENDFPWQNQHLKSLQTAYRTSPYFEFYEDDLAPLFLNPEKSLMAQNFKIFNVICDLLEISPTFEKTKQYEKTPEIGTDLRHLVNAKQTRDFNLQSYTQVLEKHHDFLPNLSILDLLFNLGPNALTYLENQKVNFF